MNILFDRSFLKSIEKINHKKTKEKLLDFISEVKTARSISSLTSIKKLKGHSISYRKKIGSYRIGFEYSDNTITFIIVLHRKDIYNKFP